MCTVKKDISIEESPLILGDSKATPPILTSADYDVANRAKAQLLLDMIYKKSATAGCPSARAGACCQTTKVVRNPYQLPEQFYHNQMADRAIWEELQRIRSMVGEMQGALAKLPTQIVAAFVEAEKNQLCGIEAQVDELDDVEEEHDEDDFDHLTETSSSSSTGIGSSKRTLSSCSSSDIEVLTLCPARKVSGTCFNNQIPVAIDISKEIAHLAKHLNLISILPSASTSQTNVEGDKVAKRFVSDLFQHWEARYQTSKDQNSSSQAPIGNIRNRNQMEVEVPEISSSSASKSSCTNEVPKLLPYTSAIDLNVWLK